MVGNGTILDHKVYNKPYWSSKPGLVYIDVPEEVMDDYYTVIAILLEDKIKLYKD